MGKWLVSTPEGKKYNVTVPEGGTQEDAINYVKSNYPSKSDVEILEAARQNQIGALPAIGAGVQKAGGDVMAGLSQLGLQMQRIPGEQQSSQKAALDKLAIEQANREMEFAKIKEQAPFLSGFGEVLPTMLTKSPLLVGVSESLKYGEPSDRITSGITGGIATKLGNWAGNKIAPYFNPTVDEQSLKSMRDVSSLGVVPRLSEATGSRGIAKLEDVIAQNPFGESVLKPQTKNQLAFNRTVSKSIGQNSPIITEDVLSNARANINRVYNTIEQLPEDVAPIRFTSSVQNAADNVLKSKNTALKLKQPIGDNEKKAFDMAEAWKDMAQRGEYFTGADYRLARENLSNLAWEAEGSAKIYYRDMLNALDDAAEQSLVKSSLGDVAKDLKIARQQYANLKTIEKGNVIKNGDVDINLLRNAIKQGKESAYKEGKLTGDLPKLAKYSEATSPIREGSQTAGRTFYEKLLNNPYTEVPASFLNSLLADALGSPITSYVPRKLAGTKTGKVTGEIIGRGFKLPGLQAERGFFQPPPAGLLTEEQ